MGETLRKEKRQLFPNKSAPGVEPESALHGSEDESGCHGAGTDDKAVALAFGEVASASSDPVVERTQPAPPKRVVPVRFRAGSPAEQSAEEWRPIPIYPGYEASDHGRIRRIGRRVIRQREVKRPDGHQPYLFVNMSIGGKVFTSTVHKLVACAFFGPRPEGMQIDHLDGNKHNNKPSNLEYVTPAVNTRRSFVLHPRTRDSRGRLVAASARKAVRA